MSHYPPPPPFGGHFPPNAQFISPPGSAYPAMPPLPYYQMRDPNNQNPTQPVGLPSAQYANTYTFNAVGPNLNGSPSRSGLPQSPYPGFRQTMNGSFLPSPYPPIPPPLYGASSQIPPSSHLRDPGLVSSQFSAGLQPKPPLHSAATADVSIDGLQLPVAAISELEDGELSEAEARESPKDSGSGDPKTSKVSINRHEDSSSLGSNNNREGTLGVANAIQPIAAEGATTNNPDA